MSSLKKVVCLLPLLLPVLGFGSELVDISPVSDRIILLHFRDGHVEHHKRGEPRGHETVLADPLDVVAAVKSATYEIASLDDPAYKSSRHPLAVGRKSKGTDFSWHVDRWVVDHAENDKPDHTEEHWISLVLPQAMVEGRTYTIKSAIANSALRFQARRQRSESVHVNTIGYAPKAPLKFAYVYNWLGDRGGLDVQPIVNRRFWLVDQATGRDAFTGKVAFRKGADNVETFSKGDTPHDNFQNADIAECDFTAFGTPGRYVVAVEGVGCSFPFAIDPDVYRKPFDVVAKGLYYQRSGIALTKPYSVYERPAPHHPGVTPGFKLMYSSLRSLDYGSESGTKAQIEPTLKGPLDAWGWYQDAGDWDSYPTHLRVAQELMLAYELNPKAFKDGELNIPESGNGIPDILDEAAWLPRFCYRLRQELLAKHYGSGGLGLRIDGDPFGSDTKSNDVGQGSWEDVDRLWIASGEDPVSTYRYAGAAAQLAFCLQLAGVKDPVDWLKEARESFAWAAAHTLAKDEGEVKPQRAYAAAALFRLTNEKAYEDQFRKDVAPAVIHGDDLYGPAVYALGGKGDPDLLAKVKKALLDTADASHRSAVTRALRWGGDFGFPMLVGQQTTPLILDEAIAWGLTHSDVYLADLYTTADYFLGTNSLNMTWVTGLGPRHPNLVFHMDSWYLGDGSPHPGTIPYGPWRKEHDRGQGPWDHDWVNKTVFPNIDLWPGAERWFDDRCTPLESEFTIHQNFAPTAAIFGVLCAPSGK